MEKRGFTLIELLVVIAIIGVLSSVVLSSLNSVRAKARDATRQADINQIRLALELYRDNYGYYPLCGASCTYCYSQTTLGSCSGVNWWSGLRSNLSVFMPSLPVDPINTNPNIYVYRQGARVDLSMTGSCAQVTGNATDYVLATKIEGPVPSSCYCNLNTGTFLGIPQLNCFVGN